MANTLSTINMTNPIRVLVSKRRIRYTQDGFDLDLTYINDRIIAMGYPAEHMESIYRNKIEDVQKMLEKNHPNCYKIYNLCSERSYNHNRFPHYSVYPFKDHNPPDIQLITSFCRDVDEYLRLYHKNVVAVHCKAGKGRTGTMICCYLLYSRQFNTAAEALHYYAQRRTSDAKGVTIPSQRRYVEYYSTLLRSNETYQPVTLYICEIRIAPALSFKEGTITVTGESPMLLPEFKRTGDEQQPYVVAKLDYCMPLSGDVKIELVKSSVLRKEKRCHFWFNTYFVEKSATRDADGNLLLELSKSEIDDAHKDKHHKEYPNNFAVVLVLRRVPNGRFSDSVSMKTTSSLLTCAIENNRQSYLPQLHQSPLQQARQQQMGTNQYRPPMIRHIGSAPGFLQHDQQPQQQQHQLQQQQNSLPTQQNNHNNHHSQQQQQNLTDTQQYFKATHDNSQQQQQQHYVDDSLHQHCLEYSETSSSESSTEEEGWDSGECLAPDNANLYYRNDNYYYGSCAGLSSDPSSGIVHPAPAPVPLQFPITRVSCSTAPSGGGSKSNSQSDVTEPKMAAAQPNLNDSCRSSGSSSSSCRSSGRRSSKTIGSSKLNQSLANTTFATSSAMSSGKAPLVVPAGNSAVSSGVLSSASLTIRVSVPRVAPQLRVSARIDSSNIGNGSLPSSAASELTAKISPTGTIAVPSTNRNAWSSIGLRRKKKKSFKANVSPRNFTLMSREFGSTTSACSGASVTTQGKVKSGKGRFHKLWWLRNMRSDHNLKETLAQNSDILTLTHSNVNLREPVAAVTATPVTLPIVVENPPTIPTVLPPTASNENLLSIDYYSSICDKQLSFESPCKSPGHLMKLNLARRPDVPGRTTPAEAVPDSECAIVIAKPSEQSPKIGFDVSPVRSPTSKVVPDFPPAKAEARAKDEIDADGKSTSPKSWSLVPKQENASFCDRILQSLASGMGSKKSFDQELQVPSPPVTSAGGSPVAPRANRYSPFSFRELGQELKSVMKASSQTKVVPPPGPPSSPPTTGDGNSTEEATSSTKQAPQ